MAELSEAFELMKIAPTEAAFIDAFANERSILISSKENGFIKLNVDSRKVIHSWAVDQRRSQSIEACFDHKSKKYQAVIDKEIVTWTDETSSLTEAAVSQIKTNCKISKLHPISLDGACGTILIDSTGKACLSLDPDGDTCSTSGSSSSSAKVESNKHKRYIWSNVINGKEDFSHTFVFIVTQEAQKYSLIKLVVGKQNEQLIFQESTEFILDPVSKESNIVACTLQEKRIVVLWSDSSFCSYDLPVDINETQGSLLNKRLIRMLPKHYNIATEKTKIGQIDGKHVFLVSPFGDDDDDDKKQGVIRVLNTKFGTEQAKTMFTLSAGKEMPSNEQQILAAQYHSGHIIIALSSSIIASSCDIVSSSLAAALGKMEKADIMPISKKTIDAGKGKLKRNIKEKEVVDSKSPEITEETDELGLLSDSSKTPTVEDFNRELHSYLNKLQKTDPEPPRKKKKGKNFAKEKNSLVPEILVKTVLKRCLEDETVWSSKVPLQLLDLKIISSSHCSDVITKAIKKDSLDVLKKCYDCIDNINEKDIVRSIQYVLSTKTDANSWKKPSFLKVKCPMEDLVRINSEQFELLAQILNYSCSEYSLQDRLRGLSRQEMKELLQILFELLMRQMMGTQMPVSHDRVVDWISMLTNAKFTTMILTSDIYAVMKRIYKAVGNQMEYLHKLEAIEPFLLYLRNAYNVPKEDDSSDAYIVEKIVF